MISAGIKEIKNNLSRYLIKVKAGKEIIITDRGKPIARIVKEDSSNRSIVETLAPLIKKGLVSLPSNQIIKKKIQIRQVNGKLASEMVVEDRR